MKMRSKILGNKPTGHGQDHGIGLIGRNHGTGMIARPGSARKKQLKGCTPRIVPDLLELTCGNNDESGSIACLGAARLILVVAHAILCSVTRLRWILVNLG